MEAQLSYIALIRTPSFAPTFPAAPEPGQMPRYNFHFKDVNLDASVRIAPPGVEPWSSSSVPRTPVARSVQTDETSLTSTASTAAALVQTDVLDSVSVACRWEPLEKHSTSKPEVYCQTKNTEIDLESLHGQWSCRFIPEFDEFAISCSHSAISLNGLEVIDNADGKFHWKSNDSRTIVSWSSVPAAMPVAAEIYFSQDHLRDELTAESVGIVRFHNADGEHFKDIDTVLKLK